MAKLAKKVREHLEKARSSALSAVETYNRPGHAFRTRTFVVLMSIAWTGLFHAVFFRRGIKPYYARRSGGRGTRYEKVEGEPKHWELQECVDQYFGNRNPPERENLRFLVRLRNKIEHRDHPELDPALFGECQANLLNFEDTLLAEFGRQASVSDRLVLALQFSAIRQREQEEALKKLQSSTARDILDFIQSFRVGLPIEVLESQKFSLKVFLIPKLANRQSAADLAVEFVPFDPSQPEQMHEIEQITALIKEKRIPVVSEGLLKPGQVVNRLKAAVPYEVNLHVHTRAWQHFKVRPASGVKHPERTKSHFCVYDQLLGAYGYTEAWVALLQKELSDSAKYKEVVGGRPVGGAPNS